MNILGETISYYDQFADDFEKIPFGDGLTNMFTTHVPQSPNLHVLDIGSGPGNLAEWISGQGHLVTCLDPSKEMVKRCKEKKLQAIVGTLDNLQVDQQFDIVLAISSLIHIPKIIFGDQIHKIVNFLSPSGLFFISMLVGDGEKYEDPLDKGADRHFSYFNKEELETTFRKEDLTILESKEIGGRQMNKTFALYLLKKN